MKTAREISKQRRLALFIKTAVWYVCWGAAAILYVQNSRVVADSTDAATMNRAGLYILLAAVVVMPFLLFGALRLFTEKDFTAEITEVKYRTALATRMTIKSWKENEVVDITASDRHEKTYKLRVVNKNGTLEHYYKAGDEIEHMRFIEYTRKNELGRNENEICIVCGALLAPDAASCPDCKTARKSLN